METLLCTCSRWRPASFPSQLHKPLSIFSTSTTEYVIYRRASSLWWLRCEVFLYIYQLPLYVDIILILLPTCFMFFVLWSYIFPWSLYRSLSPKLIGIVDSAFFLYGLYIPAYISASFNSNRYSNRNQILYIFKVWKREETNESIYLPTKKQIVEESRHPTLHTTKHNSQVRKY